MTTRRKLGHNGKSTASQSDAETSSWTASASKNKSSCLEHLPWLSEVGDSPIHTLTHAEGAVTGTISNVVQTFRSSRRQNPTKDAGKELSILLLRQFQAFRNKDPKEKQQKALPFSVLNELAKHQVTETNKTITQFTIGEAFFACRSCEYSSKVPRREQKCAKLLCLRKICFFKLGISCLHNLMIWNQQIAWPLHSTCTKTIRRMKLPFMVEERTVFGAQFFSEHVLCPKSRHIQE